MASVGEKSGSAPALALAVNAFLSLHSALGARVLFIALLRLMHYAKKIAFRIGVPMTFDLADRIIHAASFSTARRRA
eukprot:6193422-Pyramimonas_sp.AAC.1